MTDRGGTDWKRPLARLIQPMLLEKTREWRPGDGARTFDDLPDEDPPGNVAPEPPGERPCVFPECVSTDRHFHGPFPGGYENPADPDGPPIPFTSEPAPGVRDYNGALLGPNDTIDYDHPRFTHEGNACIVGCGNFNELTALRIQRERLLARIVRDSPLVQWAARNVATPPSKKVGPR